MKTIDLNCDLGEGAGQDAELMPFITSANIACGAHAGDAGTMRTAVELARRHGVAVGAHPGFDDREHFGRRELPITVDAAAGLVLTQVRALQAIAQSLGAPIVHVKPHGGLYNLAARDRGVADGIARAVWRADPRLILVGLAGSQLLAAGRARGLRVASEAFADRGYQPDGALVPRGQPGALLEDEAAAAAQALRLARKGRVRAIDGADIPVAADTICLHGDGAHALAFARRLRADLTAAGLSVQALHLPA
jgi:5-oxoprolinase (ATP-hydrolysing) subunit A